MHRRFVLLKRLPGTSKAQMLAHWQHVHAPLVAGMEAFWRYTSRYVQNHALDAEPPYVVENPYDGVVETWQRERPDPTTIFADEPVYRDRVRPDELKFLDIAGCVAMLTRSHTIIDGPSQGLKLLSFVRRRPELTHEAFCDYWLNTHGPLVRGTTAFSRHLRRYVQSHCLPEMERRLSDGAPQGGFDGVVELWFDSRADMKAAFSEPDYLTIIRPDEDRFVLKPSVRFLVAEVEIAAPQAA